MEGRRSQQRNAVIDVLMFHQRIDPLRRIRGIAKLVFRTKDQEEPVPGIFASRRHPTFRQTDRTRPLRANAMEPTDILRALRGMFRQQRVI